MANANESALWTNLRLEELIRILDVQNAESYERKKRFREKLETLKERQEELQRRRVSRLGNEGIYIDIDLIKRHARAPIALKRLDVEAESENVIRKNIINDELRELFKPKDTKVETDSDYDYESENELDVEPIQKSPCKQSRKSLSKMPVREASEIDKMSENDTKESFEKDTSTADQVKTVQVRVKKHSIKRSVKTVGHVVSTTKYLSKMSTKRKKSMNTQK